MHVVVIGAGVGGLAAAIELACAGHRATVLEATSAPGGLARAHVVDGFHFDYGPYVLMGAARGGPLDAVLKRLGIRDRITLIPVREHYRLVAPELDVCLPADRAGYERVLARRFPESAAEISRVLDRLDRAFSGMSRLAPFTRLAGSMHPLRAVDELMARGAWGVVAPLATRAPGAAGLLARLQETSVADEMAGWSLPPAAKLALASLAPYVHTSAAPSRCSAAALLLSVRWCLEGIHQVRGGIAALVTELVARAREVGVDLRLGTPVSALGLERERVTSVRTAEGVVAADAVVLAAAPWPFLERALPRGALPAGYARELDAGERSGSVFAVDLGVVRRGRAFRARETWWYDGHDVDECYRRALGGDPTAVVGVTVSSLFDGSLAPDGADAVRVATVADGRERLDDAESERRAEAMVRIARTLEPALADADVVVRRIRTPASFARDAAAPDGAILGWANVPAHSGPARLPPVTPVDGLVLAGAWTQHGAGIGMCLASGVHAAQRLS